ncbi:aspartate aminotransferase family protein [Acidaminobacter hydrogenoformans]|uniref:(S)-3-amino-2-methylpropionate transaminase n=1 Tax=Acidaminobacter hydrogenoformans DSM 2784 TaxID=1120920 RepID=A0A1G5S404_9FIRM|nr:aminotransferase class III-fold pyridoxal phosphate-dependent enzyme [Acidaminobacter hydrogenoformans]SCZ81053.1 4-aminobutyrate aminotransferase [Acidaminobacter hydrogenoformans DSM 2784]
MALNLYNSSRVVSRDDQVICGASRARYFPMVIQSGKGSCFTDLDGNDYIDFSSSAAVLNTGHSHPRVLKAIKAQLDQYIHFSCDYLYAEPQVKLAEAICRIVPGDYKKKVSFGHSGSDAIDGAIKLARAYTKRPGIVSFMGAYHGSTFGALSASAICHEMRRGIGPLLPGFQHLPYPNCFRCSLEHARSTCGLACFSMLEEAFSTYIVPEETAAILIEPIAGDMGFIEPPEAYMTALQRFCRKHGILLIADEVQQGMGRTGRWFSFEHFNLEPDIVVMGKALGSGLPISAVVAREEISNALEMPAHLFTLQGNAVAAAAALATIETIEEERLIENAKMMGDFLKSRFRALMKDYQVIGDVRGRGLSIGVELLADRELKTPDPEAAVKITYECFQKGLLMLFLSSNVLRIQPPLILDAATAEKAVDIVEGAVKAYSKNQLGDEALAVVKGW